MVGRFITSCLARWHFRYQREFGNKRNVLRAKLRCTFKQNVADSQRGFEKLARSLLICRVRGTSNEFFSAWEPCVKFTERFNGRSNIVLYYPDKRIRFDVHRRTIFSRAIGTLRSVTKRYKEKEKSKWRIFFDDRQYRSLVTNSPESRLSKKWHEPKSPL